MNEPDMDAWKLFVSICVAAPTQQQVTVNGTTVTTNNALWETWADDELTFPSNPDPAHPPQWSMQTASRISRAPSQHGRGEPALTPARIDLIRRQLEDCCRTVEE